MAKKKKNEDKNSPEIEEKDEENIEDAEQIEEKCEEELEKERKEREEKERKKHEGQLKWVLIFIVGIIGVFLITYFYIQSLGSFNYLGIDWYKMKQGELNFFYAKFKFSPEDPRYHVYFRTDPRENDIPVVDNQGYQMLSDTIPRLSFKYNIFISSDINLEECGGKAAIANQNLRNFFMAQSLYVKGAINNKSFAEENKIPFANCTNLPKNTVIMITKSDEPYIEKYGPDCYILHVGNCENIKTVEGFILAYIKQLRNE